MSRGSLKKLLLHYKYTVCGDNRKVVTLFSVAECVTTNVLRLGTLLVKNQAAANMGAAMKCIRLIKVMAVF
jgi:hypothetical protein